MSNPAQPSKKRLWILRILLLAFLWLVVSRFNEIQKFYITLMQGEKQWLALAALLQVVYYTLYTFIYKSALDTVGVKLKFKNVFPLTFATLFVNVAAPTYGASAAALFADEAGRHGEDPARAAAGMLLSLIADFLAFAMIVLIGFTYLIIYHDLQVYQITGAILLMVLISLMTLILFLGVWAPNFLKRFLQRIQNGINRFTALVRQPGLDRGWAEKTADGFIGAGKAVSDYPVKLLQTVAIGLIAYSVDIASLYFFFVAFHQYIPFGKLVAGFATGMLWWIVSITPQGIGVVEGIMALVFTSLGTPAETATVVALTFRGMTFWLPLLIGFVVMQVMPNFKTPSRSQATAWNVRIAAMLVGLMGVVNLVSAVIPAVNARLDLVLSVLPFQLVHESRLLTGFSAFGLFIVAAGLWQRKRVAWLSALVMLTISILSHLLKGLDVEEALLAVMLLAWIIYMRPEFHAASDIPSLEQGFKSLVSSLAFTLIYGVSGFYLLDKHFSVNFDFFSAVRQTISMFTYYYDPGLHPVTGFGTNFANSIYLVAGITFIFSLFMLIRPVLIWSPSSNYDRRKAEKIVENYGRSSMARLTLLEDKLYFFSPGGSVIAYVVKKGVAIALGDPIGPGEDAPKILEGFKLFCLKHDLIAAFYQVLPDYLNLYQSAGMQTACIGYEAIVNLAEFDLNDDKYGNVRSSFNKILRNGYSNELYQPPVPDDLLAELQVINDEWLTASHGSEKYFSLGWFNNDYVRSSQIMTVSDPEKRVVAFANIVPEYQRSEVTVDLVRQYHDADEGILDYLFVTLFRWAKKQGYGTFNLGLSSISVTDEMNPQHLQDRSLYSIYQHVDRFHNFKGLTQIKERFHKEWSPRYLIYSQGTLPRVSTALARADAGENFVQFYLKDWFSDSKTKIS